MTTTRFHYHALDPRGRARAGRLDAANALAASSELRRRGLVVTDLRVAPGDVAGDDGEQRSLWGRCRPILIGDRIRLFRQLQLMLRAGINLVDALHRAAGLCASSRLARVVAELEREVTAGRGLAEAMAPHRQLFGHLTLELIATGERTGELDRLFGDIVDHLDRRRELRQQLVTSLLYPAIVLLVAAVVVVFLVVAVMPKFIDFFQKRGIVLPPSTQFLVDATWFLRTWGLPILALILIAVFAVSALRRRHAGAGLKIDRALLRVPVIGPTLRAGAMAGATTNLAVLLRSGVSLVDSLRGVADLLANRALSRRFRETADAVERGAPMAPALGDPVPSLVPQLVAVGEQTGTVDEVCQELGDFYHEDLRRRTRRLAVLFEPALILIVGGIVGYVYYSFFQAILSIVQ